LAAAGRFERAGAAGAGLASFASSAASRSARSSWAALALRATGDQVHARQHPLDLVAQFSFHPRPDPAEGAGGAACDTRHIVKQSSVTQHSSDLRDATPQAGRRLSGSFG